MITFEEAYKKAKEVKDNIDYCTEYENGFLFGTDIDRIEYGGPNMPAIVVKDTGEIVNMPTFKMEIGSGDEIRDIPLPE